MVWVAALLWACLLICKMSDSDDMSANSALREPQMSIDSEDLHTYLEASATEHLGQDTRFLAHRSWAVIS